MGDLVLSSERRVALRVPLQAVAVFYDQGRATRATIENLSPTGVLVSVARDPDASVRDEVEIDLGLDSGRVAARTVRVEHTSRRTHIALTFQNVDSLHRAAIDDAIEQARQNARRRPIIILDENETRRSILVSRLAACGMTVFAPVTPLEAFDQLARAYHSGSVCVLAPCFGQSVLGLHEVICETFPWAVTSVIAYDLDATVERALASWSE